MQQPSLERAQQLAAIRGGIARRLRAMYEGECAQPIPERLLEVLQKNGRQGVGPPRRETGEERGTCAAPHLPAGTAAPIFALCVLRARYRARSLPLRL